MMTPVFGRCAYEREGGREAGRQGGREAGRQGVSVSRERRGAVGWWAD